MLGKTVGAAIAAALIMSAGPAEAQFGKLRRTIDALKKVGTTAGAPTVHVPGEREPSPDFVPEPKSWERNQSSAPLSQLPAEFSKAFPPTGDPELTAANISRLIERDMGGITKVLKLTAEREPGPMWTDRMSGGELESTWASLLIHAYVQHTDGTCGVYLTGFVVEKPWLPLTERFGPLQADNQDGNPSHIKQRCNLK